MQVSWEFSVEQGKMSQHTGAFFNGYDERNFKPEEVTARESAQNSIDAGKDDPNNLTTLIFQEIKLSGNNKEKFINLMNLKDNLDSRLESFGERDSIAKGNIKRFLEDDEVRLLLIRDYGTCGLGGDWEDNEREDNFNRLVMSLNLDDKADVDSDVGGSYGLGKTVYAKRSEINTVFYHSVFKANSRSKYARRRFMGTGIYPRHKFNGGKYGGFAFIGKDIGKTNDVAPFEDDEAQALWGEINNLVDVDISRDDQEYGTDVLILMTSLDLMKIKKSIEDYYFPALLDKKLIVKFISSEGCRYDPDILNREDLDQFVRLYKQVKSGDDTDEKELKVGSLNRYSGHILGRIALQRAEEDEANSSRNNCIALMRGTGMVVNYLKVGGDQYESAVGVFLADTDVHHYLIESENAAHSEWQENSTRLERKTGELGKKIVKKINTVTKARFVKFQRELQPEVSQTRGESGLLSKMLAKALKGSKTPGGEHPEKKFHNPVGINLTKISRDKDISKWRLKVSSNDYTPSESFTLNLAPSIVLMGDLKKVRVKRKPLNVTGDQEILNDENPVISTRYIKGDVLEFFLSFSDPGVYNYNIECTCTAEMEI